MPTLDKTDLQLLQLLQKNAHMTTKELAAAVNLSTTPVYERIKKLERDGVIDGYVAVLNPQKLNLGFVAYCNIKLVTHSYDAAQDFMRVVKQIPEVTECYSVAGAFDYLIKIHAPNMEYYREFIIDVLGRIESIGSVTSTFVLLEVKRTNVLPINAG